MASSCSRFVNRTTLSSLKSAIKSKLGSASLNGSAASSSPKSTSATPIRPFSSLSRSSSELGCAQSLLPLHSAVASARLMSCLSLNSRDCRALSQGT